MGSAQTEGKVSGTYRVRNHRWTLSRQRGPQMDPAQTEEKVSGAYSVRNHRWSLPRQWVK
ncbi:hypothetical protein XELAEV_18043465mg [Xenopus laevis]|uniref:Uncharacterized protein n=1 Tax=Xenopus laevis TaxID=8355 RepID=A0A974BWP9_XENLA|nr:hypothetical protein XELAEV_18043465mg [Xenopus laevis]